MNSTENYHLFTEEDDSSDFLEWVHRLCGISNSNMTKIDEILFGKADKSSEENAVLQADAWVGEEPPFTQDISIASISESSKGYVGISDFATFDQVDSARDAMLRKTGQGDGFISISADGDKPAIDIPVTVIIQP